MAQIDDREENVQALSDRFEKILVAPSRKIDVYCASEADMLQSRAYWEDWVIGRVIDQRTIPTEDLQRAMRRHWRVKGSVKIAERDGSFAFKFQQVKDKERVLRDGPWTVNGARIAIIKWEPGAIERKFRIRSMPVCVQMHGIPMDLMNEGWISRKASRARKVLQVILNDEEPWQTEIPKVRLEIDPYAPLYPGFELVMPDGEKRTVLFCYVSINRFCERCGMIGHILRFCKKENWEISDDLATGAEKEDGWFVEENPPANMYLLMQSGERKDRMVVADYSPPPPPHPTPNTGGCHGWSIYSRKQARRNNHCGKNRFDVDRKNWGGIREG